MLVNDVFAE